MGDSALIDRFLDMMAAEKGAAANTLLAYRSDLVQASVVLGGDFTPPLPLAAGETAPAPGGVLFRLIEAERGWVLQRNGGATGGSVGWQDQYSLPWAGVGPRPGTARGREEVGRVG